MLLKFINTLLTTLPGVTSPLDSLSKLLPPFNTKRSAAESRFITITEIARIYDTTLSFPIPKEITQDEIIALANNMFELCFKRVPREDILPYIISSLYLRHKNRKNINLTDEMIKAMEALHIEMLSIEHALFVTDYNQLKGKN